MVSTNQGITSVPDNVTYEVTYNETCMVLITNITTVVSIAEDTFGLTVSPDGHHITGLVQFSANQKFVLTLANGQVISIMLIPNNVSAAINLNAPVCSNLVYNITAGSTISITLLARNTNESPLEYVLASSPTKGTLSGSIPKLVYTPNPNSSVPFTDVFLYKARDKYAVSDLASVTITVR